MSAKSVASLPKREIENTFPKLLVRNSSQWGERFVALRKKERGIWQQYNWTQCYENVRAIFRGLLALGFAPGDRVAILGDSNPEWFWSELAIQAARGTVVAINAAASSDNIQYIIDHSHPRLVMAQDEEQVDRLLGIYPELPFEMLIFWRDKGLRNNKNEKLISLKELKDKGLIELAKVGETGHPAHFEQTLALGNGSDPAIVIYTKGTSGEPQEAVLSHEFLIFSAESVLALNPVSNKDEYVSLMNPGWFFEQVLGFGATLLTGQRLNFAESVETAQKDFREISPQTLVYPAHLWHRLAVAIRDNINASSRVKRTTINSLLPAGFKVAKHADNGTQPSIIDRSLYLIANYCGLRPLRDKHGLDHVRIAYSAGEPLPQEDLEFFRAIGIEVKQLYASSDRGIVALQPDESQLNKPLA